MSIEALICIAMVATIPIAAFLCIQRLSRNAYISYGTVLLATCCVPLVAALLVTCLQPDIWWNSGQKSGPSVVWVLLVVLVGACSLPASCMAFFYQKRCSAVTSIYFRWIIWFILSFIFTVSALIYVPGFVKSKQYTARQACIDNMRSLEVARALSMLQYDDTVNHAIESFVRDQEAHGRFLLQVSLGDLVAGGYLSREQVKEYDKGHVILVLAGDHKRPCIAGVRIRFPDGSEKAYFNYAGLHWWK